MVARPAGANQVVPGVFATPVARDDVVERQILAPHATVLAGEIVAEKDLPTGEAGFWARTLDQVHQANDRRAHEACRGRADVAETVLEHFGFASVDKNDGPFLVTHVQGFIVLIKHQYRRTHRQPPAFPGS